ncbi:MAG: hypothetical protein Q7R96_02510 [Nanoarchaeota archaeon]|nr:hypothetical protein [Nanoarchaeota archaeon]
MYSQKKKVKKAQLALEYLFILGIVLVAIIFAVVKPAYEKASGESRLIVAERSVNTLAQAVEDVYKLGPNNQKCFSIEIPSGVERFEATPEEILMRLSYQGLLTDVVVAPNKNAFGKLPINQGLVKICAQTTGGGNIVNLAVEGATCAAGDGCTTDCTTDIDPTGLNGTDPDCNAGDYSSTTATCGNGYLETGEGCEIGRSCSAGFTCTSRCSCVVIGSQDDPDVNLSSGLTRAHCPNGKLERGEECDTNQPKFDGYGAQCNGYWEWSETCIACHWVMSEVSECVDNGAPLCDPGFTCSGSCGICTADPPPVPCNSGTPKIPASIPQGQACSPNCPAGEVCITDMSANECWCQSIIGGGSGGPGGAPQTGGGGTGCGSQGPTSPSMPAEQCNAHDDCPDDEECIPSGSLCVCKPGSDDISTGTGTGCAGVPAANPAMDSETCINADDCPQDERCVPSGQSCTCEPNGAFTVLDSILSSGEDCDESAGNPTAQCRDSQGDVSNLQYKCDQSNCQMTIGTYVGDGTVQTPNDQLLTEQCEPPFEYNTGTGRTCSISGQWAVDDDHDGLSNTEETTGKYGYVTSATEFDSDGDSISDGAETLGGWNPTLIDMNTFSIARNDGLLNSAGYTTIQNAEQCDDASPQYGDGYCQTTYGASQCSTKNSHCVNTDVP